MRLLELESYNSVGDYIEENFFYEGNQLIEIERTQHEYGNRQSFERIKERFFYDEDGELDIIKRYGSHFKRVIYQRKPKGENIDETIKRIQGELIDLIPKIIEKVYSIIIVYSFGASDYFPPSLAIGTEDDMKRLINEYSID